MTRPFLCSSFCPLQLRYRAHIAEPGWVMHTQGGAGAPEPSAEVTVVADDDAVLRAAFYTVGLQQNALDSRRAEVAIAFCQRWARDITDAFQLHRLDVLCLCDLGEHGVGLQGCAHLGCHTQEELFLQITTMVADALRGDAPELAAQIQLVSGEHASYAAFERRGSMLAVEEVVFHKGLDSGPAWRADRTMLVLHCTWMNQPVKITCCHCPASTKRPWDCNVRASVLPTIFRLAGLAPFEDWSGGASEPAAWILGGDLNLGVNAIRNEIEPYQPRESDEHMVQIVQDDALLRHHGDMALVQHMRAFRIASMIGKSYGGISDAHNMVVVVAELNHQEDRTGVAEPSALAATHAAARHAASEDTGGAGEPTACGEDLGHDQREEADEIEEYVWVPDDMAPRSWLRILGRARGSAQPQ